MADIDSGRSAGAPSFWRVIPRPETALLLLGLGWTLGAKCIVVARQNSDHVLADVVDAGRADVVFFAALAVIFSGLYLARSSKMCARLTLLIAGLVLAWSMLDTAWLVATGVQLQPGVLWIITSDPGVFWPIVQTHLMASPVYAVAIIGSLTVGGAWILWRMISPKRLSSSRGPHLRRLTLAAGIVVVTATWHVIDRRGGQIAYSGEVIGFSSHWYALTQVFGSVSGDGPRSGRIVPRAGERQVTLPNIPPNELPNVVVILLESISHQVTSLSGSSTGTTTPSLKQLASEGAEFVSTRIPVPQTSKAFWATLTGSTPDLDPDTIESLIADRPYEGLASILRKCGYRTAFFEMSKGTFECAPGLFANLDFDWAWFRENLEDETAHLGYMNGDDFRMIDPMFDWIEADDPPFLLVTITSVAHDPYELPESLGLERSDEPYDRYLATVRYTDAFVGEVSKQLEARGLSENTIVCVLGDHGECFRPESPRGRWSPYEELLRVPWIVRWPGRVSPDTRVEWPCSQLDVTPTLLRLIGIEIDHAGFDGVDAFSPMDPQRRLFFSSWYDNSPIGYVEGSLKVVYWPYVDTLFEFDLSTDPDEHSPKTISGPRKDQIVSTIQAWRDSARTVVPARTFRQATVYDHWTIFSSGRSAWAIYNPAEER